MSKDRLSKARRSWNLSRIRGKDTTPEKIVRSLLHRMGYLKRFSILFRSLPNLTRDLLATRKSDEFVGVLRNAEISLAKV